MIYKIVGFRLSRVSVGEKLRFQVKATEQIFFILRGAVYYAIMLFKVVLVLSLGDKLYSTESYWVVIYKALIIMLYYMKRFLSLRSPELKP